MPLLDYQTGAAALACRAQYNLVSWALNSFGVPLDDFLPKGGPQAVLLKRLQ